MAILPLPNNVDGLLLKTRLYDEHRIQSYNNEDDVDKLADALKILLA